jgi:hypothetical protein
MPPTLLGGNRVAVVSTREVTEFTDLLVMRRAGLNGASEARAAAAASTCTANALKEHPASVADAMSASYNWGAIRSATFACLCSDTFGTLRGG